MGVSDRDVVYWAVDVSYLAGGYLAVHPCYAAEARLGRGAPNPQKRGTCLREHVQVVVASREVGEYFSVAVGEYFSAGRCLLIVVTVVGGQCLGVCGAISSGQCSLWKRVCRF